MAIFQVKNAEKAVIFKVRQLLEDFFLFIFLKFFVVVIKKFAQEQHFYSNDVSFCCEGNIFIERNFIFTKIMHEFC